MHILRRQLLSMLFLGALFSPVASASAEPAGPPVKLLRDRPAAERPQLMLLGVPHFANHGMDVVNAQVPDVLDAQRQQEIAAVAAALARFRPTKVVVEWNAEKQQKLDERYNAYRAGTYQLSRDETDQLAMRVAAQVGLARVHAVDWNKMPPGRIEDFDYEQSARREGQQARLDAIRVKSRAAQATSFLRNTTVQGWLVHYNLPEQLEKNNRAYFDYALLGEAGANWIGNWYARNLKIFANLVRLAEPGDRILVVYGQGHVFPLRQYAEQSGAFEFVSPVTFLQPAR